MRLFYKRPLALAACLFLLGSLLTALLNKSGISPWLAIIPFFLLLSLTLVLLCRRRAGTAILTALLSVCLALGTVLQISYDEKHFGAVRNADQSALHEATVCIEGVQAAAKKYILYRVSVESFHGEDSDFDLYLRIDVPEIELSPGHRFTCSLLIIETSDGNPYYYSEEIAGYAVLAELYERLDDAAPTLGDRLNGWNATLSSRLSAALPGEEGDLVTALLLGNRSALDASTTLAFRRAGLSHALALSGMHLAVLAGALLTLLCYLRAPRGLSFLLLVLFLAFYSAIAGFPLSLLRAAIMLTVAELGNLLRRTPDPETSLFFSVALIVLLSPSAILDIGLWLSFLATLGILVMRELFPRRTRRKGLIRRMGRALMFSLLIGLFPFLFTLLLTAFVFGEVSLLAIPANLVITPLVQLLLTLSPLLLIFGWFSPFVTVMRFLSGSTLLLTERISSVRGSYISVTYPVFLWVLMAVSSLILLLLLIKLKKRAHLILSFTGCVFVLVITLLACQLHERSRTDLLYVRSYYNEYLTFIDSGSVTVFDQSSNSISLYSLREALREEHVTEIDRLVITHYHEDTPEYLAGITGGILIRKVLLAPPFDSAAAEHYRETVSALKALGIEHEALDEAAILDGETISYRLLTGIKVPYRSHPAVLLRAESENACLAYASADALRALDTEATNVFLSDATIAVFGAHPGDSGHIAGVRLPRAARAVIIAHPDSFGLDELPRSTIVYHQPKKLVLPLQ